MTEPLASVAELVVELHANIDKINQTVQSLSETSHQHELENLAAERETAILSLREKRVDALKKLLAERLQEKERTEEKRSKEREEIEEQRRREWEEILAKRKREDEERAKAFEAEDLEIERLRNQDDDEREMEREEEERALFEKCELEMEKLEDQIQKRQEEGMLVLKQLDEQRKAINARIEAALSTPTVVPKLTLRSRRRTNINLSNQRSIDEEIDQQNQKTSAQLTRNDIITTSNEDNDEKINVDDKNTGVIFNNDIKGEVDSRETSNNNIFKKSEPFPISGIEETGRAGDSPSSIENNLEKENVIDSINIVEQEEKLQPVLKDENLDNKGPYILKNNTLNNFNLIRKDDESKETFSTVRETALNAIEGKPLKELKLVKMKVVEENQAASEAICENEALERLKKTYVELKDYAQEEKEEESPEASEVNFFDATEEIPSEEYSLVQGFDEKEEPSQAIEEENVLDRTEKSSTEEFELIQEENVEIFQSTSLPMDDIKVPQDLKEPSQEADMLSREKIEERSSDAIKINDSDTTEETSVEDTNLAQVVDKGEEASEAIKDRDLYAIEDASEEDRSTHDLSEEQESQEMLEAKAFDGTEEASESRGLDHGDMNETQAISIPTITIDVYEELQEASLKAQTLAQEIDKEQSSDVKDSHIVEEKTIEDHELASEEDVKEIKAVPTPIIKIDVYEELQEAALKAAKLSQEINKEEMASEKVTNKDSETANIPSEGSELTQVVDEEETPETIAINKLDELEDISNEKHDLTQVVEEEPSEEVEVKILDEIVDISREGPELTKVADEEETPETIAINKLDELDDISNEKHDLTQVVEEEPSEEVEVKNLDEIVDISREGPELTKVADEEETPETIAINKLDELDDISNEKHDLTQVVEEEPSEEVEVKNLDETEKSSLDECNSTQSLQQTPSEVMKVKNLDEIADFQNEEPELPLVVDVEETSEIIAAKNLSQIEDISHEDSTLVVEEGPSESIEAKYLDEIENISHNKYDPTQSLEEEPSETTVVKDLDKEEDISHEEPELSQVAEDELSEVIEAKDLDKTEETSLDEPESTQILQQEPSEMIDHKGLGKIEDISREEQKLTQIIEEHESSEAITIKELDVTENTSHEEDLGQGVEKEEPFEVMEIKNLDEKAEIPNEELGLAPVVDDEKETSETILVINSDEAINIFHEEYELTQMAEKQLSETNVVKDLDEEEDISHEEPELSQMAEDELSEVIEAKDLDKTEETSLDEPESTQILQQEPSEMIDHKGLGKIEDISREEQKLTQIIEEHESSEAITIKELDVTENTSHEEDLGQGVEKEEPFEVMEIENLDEKEDISHEEHDLTQVVEEKLESSEATTVKDLDEAENISHIEHEFSGKADEEEKPSETIEVKDLEKIQEDPEEYKLTHHINEERESAEKDDRNSDATVETPENHDSIIEVDVKDMKKTERALKDSELTEKDEKELSNAFEFKDLDAIIMNKLTLPIHDEGKQSEVTKVKALEEIQVASIPAIEKNPPKDLEKFYLNEDVLSQEVEEDTTLDTIQIKDLDAAEEIKSEEFRLSRSIAEKYESSEATEEKALDIPENIPSETHQLSKMENMEIIKSASSLNNEINTPESCEESSKENDPNQEKDQHEEKKVIENLATSYSEMKEQAPEHLLDKSDKNSVLNPISSEDEPKLVREKHEIYITGDSEISTELAKANLGSDSPKIISNLGQYMQISSTAPNSEITVQIDESDIKGNQSPTNSAQNKISGLSESEAEPKLSEKVDDIELSTEESSTGNSNFEIVIEESVAPPTQQPIKEESKEKVALSPENGSLLNQSETEVASGILSRYKRSISFEVPSFKGWFSTSSRETNGPLSSQNTEVLESAQTASNLDDRTKNSSEIHVTDLGDEKTKDFATHEVIIKGIVSQKSPDQQLDENKDVQKENNKEFEVKSLDFDVAEQIEVRQANIRVPYMQTEDPKDLDETDTDLDTEGIEINPSTISKVQMDDVAVSEIKEEIQGIDHGLIQGSFDLSTEERPESVHSNEPLSPMNMGNGLIHHINSEDYDNLPDEMSERVYETNLDTIYESASLPSATLSTNDITNENILSIAAPNPEEIPQDEVYPNSKASIGGQEKPSSDDDINKRDEINHSSIQSVVAAGSDDEYSDEQINESYQASGSEPPSKIVTTEIEIDADQLLITATGKKISNDFETESICSYSSQEIVEHGDDQFSYEDYHSQHQNNYEDQEGSSHRFDVDYGIPESESLPAYDYSDGPSAPTSPSEAPSSPFHENPIDEPIISSTWQNSSQDPLDEHPQEFKPLTDAVSAEYDHYQSYSDAVTPRAHHFTLPDQNSEELSLENSLSSPIETEQMMKQNDTLSQKSPKLFDHITRSSKGNDQLSDRESSSTDFYPKSTQPVIASTVSVVQRARAVFEAQQEKKRENQSPKMNPRPLSGFFNHRGSALAYRAKRSSNPPSSVIEEDEQGEQDSFPRARPASMDHAPSRKRFTSKSPTTKAREQSRLSFFEGLKNGAPNPNIFSQQ